MARRLHGLTVAGWWLAGALCAQTPPEAGPPPTRAVTLPLSGRFGQPGSVATVQTPLPGGGAQSVNTINSAVQVQGAYQGSVLSAPVPGAAIAISLDDAVRRGLGYNLGNRDLAGETLQQARDRFAAGVADTVEVVQAQEAVAAAEQDYITALYAHNLAKASLARAMGQADQSIRQSLGRP
jgi:hypothetical protein